LFSPSMLRPPSISILFPYTTLFRSLEREFNLDLITTAPSVVYKIHKTDGSMMEMHNPADMPDPVRIDHIEEPWIKATILVPDERSEANTSELQPLTKLLCRLLLATN